jgi:hypothetical protein
MTAVNWDVFSNLPGSAERNFETLCRALIRRHYGRYGRFAALANQPGVEFHLELEENCGLGGSGRWFGWQCRWYDLPRGRALGPARRKKIKDAVATTERVLPKLTDWVLWTRHPLSKGDQKWFYAIKTSMRLALNTTSDVEALLNGEGLLFRSTYFGELVLTPDLLAALHKRHVASIRHKWLPDAHQTVDAERRLRRMLGEVASWDHLEEVASRLKAAVISIGKGAPKVPASIKAPLAGFGNAAEEMASLLTDTRQLLGVGDLDLLRQRLDTRPKEVAKELEALPHRLRACRSRLVFSVTNGISDIGLAWQLLDQVDGFVGTRIVAVLADAGGGKTQLAAELTAPSVDRSAGVLLHGRDLKAGQNLDDLARRVVVPAGGTRVPSMESLLAALDAAGQRNRRRLPIVIDGLNEAQNPRDWKDPLALFDEVLRDYPYVLIVCTLRTGARRVSEDRPWLRMPNESPDRMTFADDALPNQVQRLEIPDFEHDTMEAIERYFRYFKIDPGDADLPTEMLSHPLTLRLFCEVTNGTRAEVVGIERMPGSLSALFERYLEQAAARIGDLSPQTHRYYPHDVQSAFYEIGMSLWRHRSREIDERVLSRSLGDDRRPWDQSIMRALAQEGVILRVPGDTSGQLKVMAVYDALGGYMIADAITREQGRAGLGAWLGLPETRSALHGNHQELHPLASDIFRSLVGLVPRRHHRQQLWALLDEPLRTAGLRLAAHLEAEYLDAETVQALAELIAQPTDESRDLLVRLYRTRGAPSHPLNAVFLDSLLRPMPAADRDLHWTEWIRRNKDGLRDDLWALEDRWREHPNRRSTSDTLRAQWVMWTLTTTMRTFRDHATRVLYWFGRGNPTAFFDLTCSSLEVNDPYVAERMLAASYGVAMARHVGDGAGAFVTAELTPFARRLYELMFAEAAPHGTTHLLTREYARRLVKLVVYHRPKQFSNAEKARLEPPFQEGGLRVWEESGSTEESVWGAASPFRMDFANYTLGSLVAERRNYDDGHPVYQRVRSQILWRIEQLGWSADRFGQIDRQIEEKDRSWRTGDDKDKIDRYGKKYSWIAYFEMAGLRQDEGKLERDENGRTWDVDIDPSFPAPRPVARLITDDLLGSRRSTPQGWVKRGAAPDCAPYLRFSEICGHKGPWVTLDAFLSQEDNRIGRRLFCFIRSFLIRQDELRAFLQRLRKQDLGGRWLPEKPGVIYTFAGEVPWCDTFPKNGTTRFTFVTEERVVKVRRKRPVHFLDGKRISLSPADLLSFRLFGQDFGLKSVRPTLSQEDMERVETRQMIVEEEEVRRDLEHFDALIPVRDFGWEGRSLEDESVHGATLARELAHDLRLVGKAQTLDLFTKGGTRATIGVGESEDYNNSQHLFLIKKDLLEQYLEKRHMALVWGIWGERELGTKLFNKLSQKSERPDEPYKVFQTIEHYSP